MWFIGPEGRIIRKGAILSIEFKRRRKKKGESTPFEGAGGYASTLNMPLDMGRSA